jgi:multidrug efflux pump
MTLSDIAVRRPVLATVLSLLIVVAGLAAFLGLPLRELPDVDQPVVSIETRYPGASAEVVENAVTRVIEERLAGIEGIEEIQSGSNDGRSQITIVFKLSRDLDGAASDVRDAVARIADALPDGADAPEVQKADSDAQPIIWFNVTSTTLDRLALTDWADRNVVDRIGTLDGVARVRVGGGGRAAMRVWLDREAMAARQLTVADIENALRAENVELPGGQVELPTVDIAVRIERRYRAAEDFAQLPISRGQDGELVRLGDVARVEIAPEERRSWFRGNGEFQIGLGIIRQSKSNALEVARLVREEVDLIRATAPEGVVIHTSYDATLFIAEAIEEVWITLAIAIALVAVIIYLFLGSLRAAIIPIVVIPVAIMGAFIALGLFGFSINILTLLALVLSIGLVVDDSIVVLENVQRRVDLGEPRLLAADRGTRQVFFAVIATSAVLVAVFAPLLFVEGFISRIFAELAVTLSATVVASTVVALTLTPVMASKLLVPAEKSRGLAAFADRTIGMARDSYVNTLDVLLRQYWITPVLLALAAGATVWLFGAVNKELVPAEDRGAFFIRMQAPEGAGHAYAVKQMEQAEAALMPYVANGEAFRVLVSTPGFGSNSFAGGFGIVMLTHWDERERSGQQIVAEVGQKLGEVPGARFVAGMRSPLGGGGQGDDVQIVLGGPDYDELSRWAEFLVDASRANPGLQRVRTDFEPTAPRLLVQVDRERAAALGVSVSAVGRTLETMLGSRRVTRFEDRGEDYDVILQAGLEFRGSLDDLARMFVRSSASGELVSLANLVTVEETGASSNRRRVDRLRAITISATLADGYSLGDAVAWFQDTARANLPPEARVGLTGQSKEFQRAMNSTLIAFALAMLIVFLVLAGQFESFINPLIIMMTVPLATAGGLFGLYVSGATLNLYSQIGLILLVGLAAKTGILLVEFAGQLRDEGMALREAVLESARVRFRPVMMTGLSTAIGAVPLIASTGAGFESRFAIGVVVVGGVALSTVLTLLIVPQLYYLLGRFTGSPNAVEARLAAEEQQLTQPAE